MSLVILFSGYVRQSQNRSHPRLRTAYDISTIVGFDVTIPCTPYKVIVVTNSYSFYTKTFIYKLLTRILRKLYLFWLCTP